jgi:signal transduction histidine kinase
MFIDHLPTRIVYLNAFAYLLTALLFRLVPQVMPAATLGAPLLDRVFAYGMPVFFVVMWLLPTSPEDDKPVRTEGAMLDLFYSIFIFLLVAVLFLGSLAFMLLQQADYFVAVLNTLIAVAVSLLLIGWTWNTHPGFTGIGVFFSRYLLTIGLPFEKWLHRLTAMAARESDPEVFLSHALHDLLNLPWIEGGTWRAGVLRGSFGRASKFRQDFPGQPLILSLHTQHKLSPALVWHFHLLAQLANEHYVAKLRARELQQVSYLRAVHETGARLTHDVKNLLQSLNNLCYLAQTISSHDSERVEALLQRQLPQITLRLQQTLAKLQKPEVEKGGFSPAALWWTTLRQRYIDTPIDFAAVEIDANVSLPTVLFDSVADNLLHNALLKKQTENHLRIAIRIAADASILSVSDTGSPLGDTLAHALFHGPVSSENGLGIGLYHAYQQAERHGYALRLAANNPGQVCFELRRREKVVASS